MQLGFVLRYSSDYRVYCSFMESVILKRPLKIGEVITIISVSDWLATTVRQVFTYMGTSGGRHIGKLKGKRKSFYLPLEKGVIVLVGEPAIQLDTDGSCFTGNAMINLAGESAEAVRGLLERHAVHELTPYLKSRILFWGPVDAITADTTPVELFPSEGDELAA